MSKIETAESPVRFVCEALEGEILKKCKMVKWLNW